MSDELRSVPPRTPTSDEAVGGRPSAVGRRRSAVVIALAVVALLFVVAVAAALALEPAAPAATDIGWQVIASGGQTMSSPSFTMMSTAGQPVAGAADGPSHSLLSGFWYGLQETVRQLLLPFITGSP